MDSKRARCKRWKLWRISRKCHYCRRVLLFSETTLDHVIPRSKGGGNNLGNLVLACAPCNQAKADTIGTS